MVRAAVSGAIDYSDADPENKRWRIKHRLVITEISRRDRQQILERYHAHLCSYLSHSRLTEESFEKLKDDANDAYKKLKTAVYPWLDAPEKENETKPAKSKIDANTEALINRYKTYLASRAGN
jgi:methyltransferase-like protein